MSLIEPAVESFRCDQLNKSCFFIGVCGHAPYKGVTASSMTRVCECCDNTDNDCYGDSKCG